MHPDDDEGEATLAPAAETKPKPRPRSSVPVLFEDPTTEDEEAKPTEAGVAKEAIAALLEESRRAMPDPRASRRRRSVVGRPAVVAPRRARSAGSSEATPAVGTAFIASLLHAAEFEDGEVTEKRPALETITDLEIAAARARFDAGHVAAAVRALDALAARLEAKGTTLPASGEKIRQDALALVEERCIEQLEGARAPRVVLDRAGVAALSLDHKAGFLLSLIDGSSTVQELLDVCGMSQMDALALLYELGERGVIVLESQRR